MAQNLIELKSIGNNILIPKKSVNNLTSIGLFRCPFQTSDCSLRVHSFKTC